MYAIICEGHGDESVLRWAEVPDPEPRPGQVLLRVRATSVNRADLLQRMGHYPPPPGASPILGLEAAGEIIGLGAGVTSWDVGQHAMALLSGGGYAELAVVDARHLTPIPPRVGLPNAGAVPEVFLTAYLNLVEVGGLQPGERVLVHGGSGGVGTAAIQLARHLAAETWTTAGGPERTARCLELGAARAIDHRTEDFQAALAPVGGAHVILDIMGAKYLQKNLASLKTDGRLVIIGLQGGLQSELPLGMLLGRRLSIFGSTLRSRSDDFKAGLVGRFSERVWPMLAAGQVEPIIDCVLPLKDAAEAHRRMARGDQFGKIVLVT